MGKASGKREKDRSRRDEPASTPLVESPLFRHAMVVAALALIVFFAYSNSIQAPLFFDNETIILKDTRLRSVTAEHVERIFTLPYWETGLTAGLYRPLTTLTYLFNYSVLGNGPEPAGYHWVNLLLQILNAGLVYALGLAVFGRMAPAVALGALWGLHPVLTESVTNVVGRADLLAANAILFALFFHRFALRSSGGRRALWIALMAATITKGLFFKEGAIVVVAVIVLWDLAFERTHAWQARVASYAALALPVLLFFYVRFRVLGNLPTVHPFVDNPLVDANFWAARLTAFKVIGRYAMTLLWPAGLSADYSFNEVPLSGWGDWAALLALAACIAAAVVALRSWKRNPPLFFFIAFFFATLAPVSNLIVPIGSIMAERFLYLPSIGFVGAVICAFLAWRQHRRPSPSEHRYAVPAVVGLIALVFAARTFARNEDWLDQRKLWRSSIETAPGSYKNHLLVAYSTVPKTPEEWSRSIHDIDQALAILAPLPDSQSSPFAYSESGMFYRIIGDRVVSGAPSGNATAGTLPEFWYRKALSALERGRLIDLAHVKQVNSVYGSPGKPVEYESIKIYLELGRVYRRLEQPARAREAFEYGRNMESQPDLLEELAQVYAAAGEPRAAAIAVLEALPGSTNRGQLQIRLAEYYGLADPNGCAVIRQGTQSAVNFECPLVKGDICTASRNVMQNYRRRNQQWEADAIRKTAMQDLGCSAAQLQ